MWMLLPAVYLAIAHIAGDNVAVVPDMAAALGEDIYVTTIFAYIVIGSVVTGLSAWIGVTTGQELVAVVKRLFGCTGKRILALITLAVCIPASSITGGFYAGWVISMLTGLPVPAAIPVCVLIFSLLAAGYGQELLKVSNYVALLLIPIIIIIFFNHEFTPVTMKWNNINWMLVSALVGYNAGGMRPALIVETAAYLSRKGYKAVLLVVLAKLVEGMFTLAMAHSVVLASVHGPLALTRVVDKMFGAGVVNLFSLILFCTFMNTMAPAMKVNARQISILTGLSFWPSLVVAALTVCIGSFMDYTVILSVMSGTGVIIAAFIVYTAYFLHK